jgi:hypothetical protein
VGEWGAWAKGLKSKDNDEAQRTRRFAEKRLRVVYAGIIDA